MLWLERYVVTPGANVQTRNTIITAVAAQGSASYASQADFADLFPGQHH